MVEAAVVASAMLTFIFGILQIGMVGLEQVTIDAATFLNAHQTVIGVKDPNGPNDATSQVFPNVKASSYQGTTVVVAPTPTVPVDCADRQADGIGQPPAASSAQPRQ